MRARKWFFVGIGTLTAACSVVNAFDPVVTADAGADAAVAPVDAHAEAAVDAAPAEGAIALGATVEGATSRVVLTALDPKTGHELPAAREPMNVTAILYDGLRDLWFVFESKGAGFIPAPTDELVLHIRELDAASGRWTERQKLPVPPHLSFSTMAVVRERIGYVAYGTALDADGGLTYDFVTIDTSSPSAAVVRDRLPIAKAPIGAIGTRSATGVGGVINFVQRGTCPTGACVEVLRALIPPSDPAKLTTVVPNTLDGGPVPYSGSPTFGTTAGTGLDMMGSRVGTTVTIHFFQPLNNQAGAPPVDFEIGGSTLKPMAYAECLQTMLVVETNTDLLVHAVPVKAGGTPASSAMNHSGQGVYFEPYTSTVITPFSQGPGYDLTAFTLSGTATAPVLTRRQAPAWAPPAELRAHVVTTRTPATSPCP